MSAAASSLHAGAFWPHQSGEKSARAARFRLGAQRRDGRDRERERGRAPIGPSSCISRLTMPRAGRPVKRLVSAVWNDALALDRGAVQRARRGFRAEQVRGADLHARRAERKRRGDTLARRRCRPPRSPGPSRHARSAAPAPGADLRGQVVGQEHAAVTARLEALRDDRVDAVRFEPARLVDRRRGREHVRAPIALTRASCAGGRQDRNGKRRRAAGIPRARRRLRR